MAGCIMGGCISLGIFSISKKREINDKVDIRVERNVT